PPAQWACLAVASVIVAAGVAKKLFVGGGLTAVAGLGISPACSLHPARQRHPADFDRSAHAFWSPGTSPCQRVYCCWLRFQAPSRPRLPVPERRQRSSPPHRQPSPLPSPLWRNGWNARVTPGVEKCRVSWFFVSWRNGLKRFCWPLRLEPH